MQIFSLFFRHASFVFVACQVLLLAPTVSVAQEDPVATFSDRGFRFGDRGGGRGGPIPGVARWGTEYLG